MKVSLNSIKQFTGVDLPVDELVDKINQQLGGVEEVVDLGVRYKDALIVKVISAVQHPNADRLRVCLIDDGGVREDVPRDDNGYVQVVCGAPNARADIFAVWLPPKSTVPASYDEAELFVLDARPLRGTLSQGMLAALDELALGSDHEGILEVDPTEWTPNGVEIKPGVSFARVYGLDDTIIDIENKMFTHRPDLFGQLGVAREISAITKGVTDASEGVVDTRFENPDWYWSIPEFAPSVKRLDLAASHEAPGKSARFMAVAMDGVQVKPSPLWLQIELIRLGGKPINNIVDITNYVMLLTAQPTHAYDYDKVNGQQLAVRMAEQGEKVTLLNHKEYELSVDDIVIADELGPVGLAGVMGAADSEVTTATTRIILEVGTFDMYAVRKSAMRHGVFTDALTRFNKGQSPLQNDRVMKKLMDFITEIANGQQASDVLDRFDTSGQPLADSVHGEVRVSSQFINARLGTDLTVDQIGNLLRRVNFASHSPEGDRDVLLVTAPFWRTDIELPEDIVEEVGRLYGFDKLPRDLPTRSTKPTPKNAQRELARRIRDSLSRAGTNEVLTYSFLHENVLTGAHQNPELAFRIGNALSPDLQYYRFSITPSLLDKVHANSKAGYDEFALFEIGTGHSKAAMSEVDGLPVELARIGLTYASKVAKSGAPYYRAKSLVEYLGSTLGLTLTYKALPAESSLVFAAPFEPRRSARIVDAVSGQSIGVVGEYKQSVVRAFKLPDYSAGFELLPEAIELALKHVAGEYTPLSRYPGTQRDICFQVDQQVAYGAIIEAVQQVLTSSELQTDVQPVDIYQAEDRTTKNVTIRISLSAHDRTLTADDAAAAVDSVIAAVIARTNALVV